MEKTLMTTNVYPQDSTVYRTVVNQQLPQYIVQPQRPIGTNLQKDRLTYDPNNSIYCPVCHMEYSNEQVEDHLDRHYQADSYNFKFNDLNTTKDSVEKSHNTLYPMVQPMQFWTKQLNEVQRNMAFESKLDEKNKKQSKTSVIRDAVCQTPYKPPLQTYSQQSDAYNCFDNLFNQNSKFTKEDLLKNNAVIASKRHLNDWEYVRHKK